MALAVITYIDRVCISKAAPLIQRDMGFTKDQIADVSKIYGFVMTILGALLGGALVFRVGAARLLRNLWPAEGAAKLFGVRLLHPHIVCASPGALWRGSE